MGNDMVVALPRATVDRVTLFGHNCNRTAGEPQALVRVPGRDYAAGERVRTPNLSLPQARQTATVVASRCAGTWGYQHGFNEFGVAAGITTVRTRLAHDMPGLTGPDLVRLALERSHNALQAVDVVTDFVSRHGPGAAASEEDHGDPILLLCDAKEAYLLAACGSYWTVQQVREVRAQCDVCDVRQDWDRISPGLAGLAIQNGWWPDDGSKLDFAGALVGEELLPAVGLRRWGRATVTLEQNNGMIDPVLLRRLLTELGSEVKDSPDPAVPAASFIARLPGDDRQEPLLAWWCCGNPGDSVLLPIVLDGELPNVLIDDGNGSCELWNTLNHLEERCRHDGHTAAAARSTLAALQTRLDRESMEFVAEWRDLHINKDRSAAQRLATAFMQHATERFEEACDSLKAIAPTVAESAAFAALPSARIA